MTIASGSNNFSMVRSPNLGLTYSANYPGRTVVVEESTNLTNTNGWQSIEETRMPANGMEKKYSIPASTNQACFFRLLVPIDRSPLITDPKLEDAIRANLGLNNTDALTEANLATITNINLSNLGITTLDGIQYLTGLTSLTLTNNPIIDYSALSKSLSTNSLTTLNSTKALLINNNRDHFAETNAQFYIQANTVVTNATGTLIRYVHPAYNNQIHTEGQWYAGFLLAHQGTTTNLTATQQTLLENIITGGLDYFPNLTINGQETTLKGWIKDDKTSAADADVFRMVTLSLAGKITEARVASQDFFKYETKDIQGLTLPLCGVNDTSIKLFDSPFYTIKGNQTIFLWNPSYSYSYAANVLNDLDPKWANLQRSQHLVNSKVVDTCGVVDWCVVLVNNETGAISVSLDLDSYFPRTMVDSFHINQIFSSTIYANNWRNLNIFSEDENGYMTYNLDATTRINSLINSLPPTPENAKTIQALTILKENSQQEFPGRGANITNTEQKEWPRFIMDHLMSYATYNDAYSLEMLNKIVQKHGFDLNGLLYYGWPNEIVIALRTALKATFNNLSASDITTFLEEVLTLTDQNGKNWYGNKWYIEGKDWTFNQFIIGIILNTVIQKIKLP